MSTPYVRAPHKEGSEKPATHTHNAPNAALLIDFDNVTMGMRSDLSKELKTLLNSDIIRGKVAVQRAYADWRRYPQYIVPLSEASIDLIFAPAYGSSKKNATDIRMAIDALELIFIRPEIGTFILLTGDSDFSSLVLKLKEYGKYVIGVGIQESSSDILVQNCDEYYSYTSLAGLRKTTDADTEPVDPWLLVERALERMEKRNDVMRSDRLKQVMMEIDAGFDEGEYGFSKFSKFLTEASSRGLVDLKRMENGQYEVRTQDGGGAARKGDGRPSGGETGGGEPSGRSRGRATRSRSSASKPSSPPKKAPAAKSEASLDDAYDLLRDAVDRLTRERDLPAVRDSDVKRKILDRDRSFDEAEFGFSKFSRFLQQADEDGIVLLRQRDSGNYEVGLPSAGAPAAEEKQEAARAGKEKTGAQRESAATAAGSTAKPDEPKPEPPATTGGRKGSTPRGRGLGPRRGEKKGGRAKSESDGPPILEGQVVSSSSGGASTSKTEDVGTDTSGAAARAGDGRERATERPVAGGGPAIDPEDLGLPTDRKSVVRYLANSYRGVGDKTAERLVDEIGADLFEVLQVDPGRVRDVVPSNRADQLLEAWKQDYTRRKGRMQKQEGGGSSGAPSKEESTPRDEGEEPVEDDTESKSEPSPSRLGRRRGRRTRG